MRLGISSCGFECELKDDCITVVTVENNRSFREILMDIWAQYQGDVGEIKITEAEKNIKIADKTICVYNPFVLDANNKKILSRLYAELCENANTYLQVKTADIRARMISYMDELVQAVQYDVVYDFDVGITELLKCFNVRINQMQDCFLERIIDYLRAYNRICNINICIAINLKDYLTSEELKKLYQFLLYEKIIMVIIENKPSSIVSGYEKNWIIDDDQCIIEVN